MCASAGEGKPECLTPTVRGGVLWGWSILQASLCEFLVLCPVSCPLNGLFFQD